MEYRTAIESQPFMIKRAVPKIRKQVQALELSNLNKGPIGLIGIGASYEALNCLQSAMVEEGIRPTLIPPSRLKEKCKLNDLSDFIAVSNSGRSAELIAFAKLNPNVSILAITGTATNPLKEIAQQDLCFFETDDSTPSAFGYTLSLLAAGMLLDEIIGRRDGTWEQLADCVERQIQTSFNEVGEIAQTLKNVVAIDCVGGPMAIGTANETALLFRESTRIPAWAFDTLNYLHGPMEPIGQNHGLMVFGNGREIQIAVDMAGVGCRAVLVTSELVSETENLSIMKVKKCANPIAQEIINIIPAQILSSALSNELGLKDVKFRYRQTDTKIKD